MPDGAKPIPPHEFSYLVFSTLALVFGLSVAVFAWLVRRWTRSRLWVDIADWARARGYRASTKNAVPPPPLDDLLPHKDVTVSVSLSSADEGLFRIDGNTGGEGRGGAAAAVPPSAPADPNVPRPPRPRTDLPGRWHVLVRRIESDWRPTALRPTPATSSFLDLYSLSSFPLMGDTQRFTVYGTDSTPARRISASKLRSLLPPDVGLLLHGRHLVLDFSGRPFDPIEFDRMRALAQQIAMNLPPPS